MLSLLPIIFGSLGAAGTIAGIVNSVQQKNEQARHNAKMEEIAKEKQRGCICNNESEDEDLGIEKIKDAILLLTKHGFKFV